MVLIAQGILSPDRRKPLPKIRNRPPGNWATDSHGHNPVKWAICTQVGTMWQEARRNTMRDSTAQEAVHQNKFLAKNYKRQAVRESAVSLQTWAPNWGQPLKPLEHHRKHGIEGFKGSQLGSHHAERCKSLFYVFQQASLLIGLLCHILFRRWTELLSVSAHASPHVIVGLPLNPSGVVHYFRQHSRGL